MGALIKGALFMVGLLALPWLLIRGAANLGRLLKRTHHT